MHRILLLILAIPALLANSTPSCAADETQALPKKENFHLFLLLGQSNMAGRGAVAKEDKQPHSRVLMYTKAGAWVPAVDPLHFDKPQVVGVGLGKTFGTILADADPNVVIGLVPCAVGGSPIASWEPKGYHRQTKTHPWDDAMKRAKPALRDGTLRGILWHQGESDANPDAAPIYEAKLHGLIARLRDQLNAPHVPFIAGQMGQFKEQPWSESKKHVDLAHQQLPKKVEHTAFVNSDGLQHKGDKVHFDAKSYRELGRRYAKAYLKMSHDQAANGKQQ